jgi:hypothetical protein
LLDLGVWWKYRLVGHVWVHGSRLSSLSLRCLRKWYLTSMCLVSELSIGFFATLMALVLSHWSGTWVYCSPMSLMVYVIQRSWEQQLAAATYSASVVDWATLDCLREDHDTKEYPKTGKSRKWTSYPTDTRQNSHLKNHEAPKKKTQSTKGQSGECDASIWICTWPLADVKYLETLENERTDIPRAGCPASSSSIRGVTRSCFGTPSSPRVHLLHLHQEL